MTSPSNRGDFVSAQSIARRRLLAQARMSASRHVTSKPHFCACLAWAVVYDHSVKYLPMGLDALQDKKHIYVSELVREALQACRKGAYCAIEAFHMLWKT